ncbi:MAG TPA: hypothetical protein VFX20_17615 [Steroidobacteraceae bacterium]|nr:hypothetical protein [Steroidobacteraceae bacterium]
MTQVVLIHAMRHSLAPIEAAFAEHWCEARLTNLLDDSLATNLAAAPVLDNRMTQRFLTLGRYAATLDADAILFTCSAFVPCIHAVRDDLAPLPVRGPNEAMIAEIAAIEGRVALVATFAPTLRMMMAAKVASGLDIEPVYVDGALAALDAGDPQRHDRLVVQALQDRRYDAVALVQYSLARAAPAIAAQFAAPVLTAPAAAVQELRRATSGAQPSAR